MTGDAAGAPTPFADRLAEAVERKRTQLVVGLDPVVDLLPVELRGEADAGRAAAAGAVERFCKGIVDAVAPYVVAVKPQAAFFEALGSDGWGAFEAVARYAREAGLLVIADAKRGDIGSTARAYATAFLEPAFEVRTSRNTPAPSRRHAARNGSTESRPRYGLTVRASASGAAPNAGSRNAVAYARAVEPMSPRFASAITSRPASRA